MIDLKSHEEFRRGQVSFRAHRPLAAVPGRAEAQRDVLHGPAECHRLCSAMAIGPAALGQARC